MVVSDPLTGRPARFLFSAGDNRGIPGSFDYFEGDDSHVFLADVPANLGDHYAGGYQTIPDSEEELATLAQGDAYRLDDVKRLVPRGDFLEIGPWIGLVAYSAKQAGYDVSVLEMSQPCVDLLNRVGIHAVQTDDPARSLGESDATYDVIGMWHSIEHMREPWRVIAEAAKALNPGGVLVIAAPNPRSAQFRLFGRTWVHLDAPRHLHLIAAETYQQIAEANGLELIQVTTADELGRRLDDHGWGHQLARWQRQWPLLRPIIRWRIMRILQRLFYRTDMDGAGFTLVMGRPRA